MSKFLESNENHPDLAGKAVRSGVIAVSARALTGIFQVISTVVLARMLAPEDFGLVAISFAVTSFAPVLIDLGLTDATTREPTLSDGKVSALFWLNAGLGLLIAILLVLGGPVIARIYDQPKLGLIIASLALSFVFSGLTVQHLALLRRTMHFSDIAVIEVVSYIAGAGVAILFASLGSGYWALVARPIVISLFLMAGAWIRCDWRPSRPEFGSGSMAMAKFGVNVMGFSLTSFVARAADRAVLGYVCGPRLVGFYQNAFLLYENSVNSISLPLHKVGVSALSKQIDDPALLRRNFAAALSTITFYTMPAFAMLAVLGHDLVPLLLGPKWTEAGALLSILALRGIVHNIDSAQGWLHLGLGFPNRWLRWGVVNALAHTTAVLIGVQWGVKGVAIAYTTTGFVLALPALLYAGRPAQIGSRLILSAVGRQFVATVVAFIAGWGVFLASGELPGLIPRMLLSAGATSIVYAITVLWILRVRGPLGVGLTFLLTLLPARFRHILPSISRFADADRKDFPFESIPAQDSPDETDATLLSERSSQSILGQVQPLLRRAAPAPAGEARETIHESVSVRKHLHRSRPLVSILIPAYNAEEWIRETLRSATAQTWDRREIIVVDDGSTDGTARVAQQFASKDVNVIVQPNGGACAARNALLAASQGDYIQWLDADDLLAPDKISCQMRLVEEVDSVRTLFSSAWGRFYYRSNRARFTPTPLWGDLSPCEWLLRKMEHNVYMQTSTWLISRALTEAAGPWDPRLLVDNDGEYITRVLLASDIVRFVPEARVYYRRRGSDRISYVGHSQPKLRARFLSTKLHIERLRSLGDSERTRAACLRWLQTYVSDFNPQWSQIADEANALAQSLGGTLRPPELRWKYAWLQKPFGWNFAKRVQVILPNLKESVHRQFDGALYEVERRLGGTVSNR